MVQPFSIHRILSRGRLMHLIGVGAFFSFGALLGAFTPATAQNCTVQCGSRQIQFTPGQRIQVEMINRTANRIQVEEVIQTDAVPLSPGQTLQLTPSFGTQPNISVVFWDETQLSLRAVLSRPQPNTLWIELFPGGRPPGDRSIYIENDGKVAIF